ncbi:carbamoyltransferase C-terminal domain-containing protein [Paenibacillus psychroresistens]|nr:carbamoyltransferase C-terminal domain-containing protein [Paenibacillus psychroresistens]
MKILGIGGGLDRIHEYNYEFPIGMAHDSAAVLLVDGKIVAGIEEERLNRIKHTNKSPVKSMRFCLEQGQINIREINKFAVYGSEKFMNFTLQQNYLEHSGGKLAYEDVRTLVRAMIRNEFEYDVDPSQIVFVPHHVAHAASSFFMSGFEESLIMTIDGQGDGVSSMLFHGNNNSMEPLATVYQSDSLGFFYLNVIKFIGYSMFDEYKVMGLAPYGQPRKYKSLFKRFYSLLPEGSYKIHTEQIHLLFAMGSPRKKGEPFTQVHKDIAASLQASLEEIVFHCLSHYKEKTGLSRLCLAGGVAHNCTLNGKIAYSAMFEEVFIQPAAHDAGSVLGAALQVYHTECPEAQKNKLEHVYWGKDIGTDDSVVKVLQQWSSFIEFEKKDDIEDVASQLISEGMVLGWVQGRSEFGPRALGNRSIIADPRPAENKEIINAMVKKREGYRPFAPSVLEEEAGEYFELPPGNIELLYMIHVLKVKEIHRQQLGAITHMDGTARVQTVSQRTNPRYWKLIRSFQEKTGIPLVLNTSFNNHAEPIIDSVQDAIVCYLTTGLHYLVIGNYLIRRKQTDLMEALNNGEIIPSIPPHVRIYKTDQSAGLGPFIPTFQIGHNYSKEFNRKISSGLYPYLLEMDGATSLNNIIQRIGTLSSENRESIMVELINLWSERMITITPAVKVIVKRIIIENIAPFNDIYYKSCLYNSLFPAVFHFNKSIAPFLINDVIVYDITESVEGPQCLIEYLPNKSLEEMLEDVGISYKGDRYADNLLKKVISAINQGRPVLFWVDCFDISIRADTFHKKHLPHTILVYGYDEETQILHIIEHKQSENLSYARRTIPMADIQKAYDGFHEHFHRHNPIMETYYEFYLKAGASAGQELTTQSESSLYLELLLRKLPNIQSGLEKLKLFLEWFSQQIIEKRTPSIPYTTQLLEKLNSLISAKQVELYKFSLLFHNHENLKSLLKQILGDWVAIRAVIAKYYYSNKYNPELFQGLQGSLKRIYISEIEYYQKLHNLSEWNGGNSK